VISQPQAGTEQLSYHCLAKLKQRWRKDRKGMALAVKRSHDFLTCDVSGAW